MPNKIKHFAWKACNGILPTKESLFRRMITESKTCEACCGQTKTTMHVLCFCNCGTEVWKESKLALPCNVQESWSFMDTFRLCLVAVKRFLENTYFPEMLISGKGKCFHGVWLHFKKFSGKYFLVFGKEEEIGRASCRERVCR